MANDRQPILGQRNLNELFSDFQLFRQVVTPGQGSRTLSEPGYYFVGARRFGDDGRVNSSVQYRENQCYFLYGQATDLLMETGDPYCMEGRLNSFEIVASPYWADQGVALIVATDRTMIPHVWIATVPLDQLPTPSEMTPFN